MRRVAAAYSYHCACTDDRRSGSSRKTTELANYEKTCCTVPHMHPHSIICPKSALPSPEECTYTLCYRIYLLRPVPPSPNASRRSPTRSRNACFSRNPPDRLCCATSSASFFSVPICELQSICDCCQLLAPPTKLTFSNVLIFLPLSIAAAIASSDCLGRLRIGLLGGREEDDGAEDGADAGDDADSAFESAATSTDAVPFSPDSPARYLIASG